MRRTQEKNRVLRHQIEQNIKQIIPDSAPIMAWLVQWAAELLSKYACGDDGRSLHERFHGEKCLAPFAPFGESIMYSPMKTLKRDKGEVAKRSSIWLGILARTQETFVGTEIGVIKCTLITRLVDDEKWSANQILKVKGTSWEPVFGKGDRRVPVAVDSRGNGVQMDDDDEIDEQLQDGEDGEDPEMSFRGSFDKLHVSKKAIERYGPTENCPACASIVKRGMVAARVGINHNDKCRKRIIEAMQGDRQYRRLMQKHSHDVTMVQDNNNKNNDSCSGEASSHNIRTRRDE